MIAGTYLRLLRLARSHASPIAVAAACLLAATAADLWLLVLFKRYVDGEAGGATALTALALVVARGGLSYAGALLGARAATALVADLQQRLYAHLHGLSLEFFHRSRPGDLLSRIFHDVEAAARLVAGVIPMALEAPVRLAAMFAVAWALHPRLAMIAAVVLVPAVILERALGRSLRARYRGLYEDVAALYESVQEALGAIELVKTFAREGGEVDRFRGRMGVRVRKEDALNRVQAAEEPVGHALRMAALIGIIAYGAREVAAGALSPGALAAALLASYAFMGALQSAASLYSAAQGGLAAADRLFAVLDEVPSVAPPVHGAPAAFAGELRFEDVSFAYPGRARAIEGLRFSIRRGEKVAVVGRTGSGKTTLLRLALRLFDPVSGKVTLDGVDLRQIDLAGLRGLFAVVPQDVLLFDRTVLENIAFADPGAGRERLLNAARLAGLDGVAARLPQGLDTPVGTRALALSAGERQRIALARAMVRDAPILLLDEATSALDAETEREIQAALDLFTAGRTVIAVAHRLATLRSADRILVLDEGRVVEEGPHDALLARGGAYRRLCEAHRLDAP